MAGVNPPQLGGPQPNLGLLAHGLQEGATELANFANLPVFAQGDAIMQLMQQNHRETQRQMQQMQTQMQQMEQRIVQQIQQLRTDITTLRQASVYNSAARLENSNIRKTDTAIIALHEPTTNANIAGFPATPVHLANRTGPALDRVLAALGQPTNGTTADKKQRLRFYTGLRNTSDEGGSGILE
ncbi:uncharacterized protein BDZ99DRAFT_503650 [Mytilinidion resinicola]|uniref:Uncharacterized protein n=1 Tax=Mytilinidion resinicola TaxID=574789 RepID=A0A6A6Y5C5_9PEZI|nr:uncharacterized protein BDZ99DRAFT_503650 [Mytilinidion resinicola]KAF2802987.1 hypothetical protein BDZ99DRAFT_503650 [Mytilinidion resinicola]